MKQAKNLLFIGSFLSSKDGTLGPAERLIFYLGKDYNIKACSRVKNKFFRFFDILISVSFWKYDILHVDVFSGKAMLYAFIAIAVAKLRSKKIITNLHGGKLPYISPKKNQLLNRILKGSDKIITPSQYLHSFFTEQGFEIRYLPNFIDTGLFPFKPFKEFRDHRILWIRALSPEYNPDIAIRAIYLLKERYPEISLTMIGPDKGESDRCRKLIRELGIYENIRMVGMVSNNELIDYFHSHDVFINTPSYESFGLGVLEAVSAGIPVVSFRVGEIPFLWRNEEEVLLCDKQTPDALADKIAEVFNSPEKTKSMVLNAKNKAMNFSWQNIHKRWKDLLEHELS
jgi:glycosyltransferase involved in cell wall biosynthesis